MLYETCLKEQRNKRAKTTLIDGAKKVEAAETAVGTEEELKSEEKELVKQAYTVRDMPAGTEKESKKEELISTAKELEKERASATVVREDKVTEAEDAANATEATETTVTNEAAETTDAAAEEDSRW